jgi:hypothetical protein
LPVAMTTAMYNVALCIILFTFIIKSIYVIKLQLIHTYIAQFRTKKGHLAFLYCTYESSWVYNALDQRTLMDSVLRGLSTCFSQKHWHISLAIWFQAHVTFVKVIIHQWMKEGPISHSIVKFCNGGWRWGNKQTKSMGRNTTTEATSCVVTP